jgi:hypothetical protein
MDNNNPTEGQMPEFSSKSEYSKAILVMEQVKAVRDSRSKEMKSGYWNTKLDKEGNAHRVYVDDTRIIYLDMMDSLVNLLAPEIASSKHMMEVMEQFQTDKEAVYNKFCYKERVRKTKKISKLTEPQFLRELKEYLERKEYEIKMHYRSYDMTKTIQRELAKAEAEYREKFGHDEVAVWEYTGDSWIPQVGDVLLDSATPHSWNVVPIRGLWDTYVNAYYDKLIPLYDSLWREIQTMIDGDEVSGFKSKRGF